MDLTVKFATLTKLATLGIDMEKQAHRLTKWLGGTGEQLQRKPFIHQRFTDAHIDETEHPLFASPATFIYGAHHLMKQHGQGDPMIPDIVRLAFEMACIGTKGPPASPHLREHIATLGMSYLFNPARTIRQYTGPHTHLYRFFELEKEQLDVWQKYANDFKGPAHIYLQLQKEKRSFGKFAIGLHGFLAGGKEPGPGPY